MTVWNIEPSNLFYAIDLALIWAKTFCIYIFLQYILKNGVWLFEFDYKSMDTPIPRRTSGTTTSCRPSPPTATTTRSQVAARQLRMTTITSPAVRHTWLKVCHMLCNVTKTKTTTMMLRRVRVTIQFTRVMLSRRRVARQYVTMFRWRQSVMLIMCDAIVDRRHRPLEMWRRWRSKVFKSQFQQQIFGIFSNWHFKYNITV